MAEERFNVCIHRISEMPSGPGVRTIEPPIKDTYHTSVLFTVKLSMRMTMSYKIQERIRTTVTLGGYA